MGIKSTNKGVSSSFFNSKKVSLAVVATVLTLSGCASVSAQYNPGKPHHTPDGFKNNYIGNVNKSRSDFFLWQYQRLLDGLPKPPQTPTPVVLPNLTLIQSNGKATRSSTASSIMQPAITWIGHATMLVQANGLNVLTDPIFSERASPVQSLGPKRTQPPGVYALRLTWPDGRAVTKRLVR